MTERPYDLLREAFDFVHDSELVADERSLKKAFAKRVHAFGFDHYLCLQLKGPGGALAPDELFGDWNRLWSERYLKKGYYRTDAVLRTMLSRDRPFAWTDLPKRRPLSAQEQHVMNEAREYGGLDGFVTPIRNLDGSFGNVTLFARKCDLSKDTRSALHFMSLHFGGAARRLRSGGSIGTITLPKRERDIVAYLARGFTQSQIADKLKLSDRTVETYVRRARVRFGVATTAQLCVEAVRQGAIQL